MNDRNSSQTGESTRVPVDLYSVVLSTAGLVLATLLGGGGSLSVVLALFRSPRVAKHNYTLVLVFFFLTLALDVVWAPLELLHLLTFHLSGRNPTSDLGVATFTLFIFLLGCEALLVAAFCVENVLRLLQSFPPTLRRSWSLLVVTSSLLLALILALAVVGASINPEGLSTEPSYLVLDSVASRARITVLTLLLVAVSGGAVVVVVVGTIAVRRGTVLVKNSESFLSAQSRNSSSGAGPTPLLPYKAQRQDGPGCSSDECDQISASASPASSQLPDILEPAMTVTTPTGNGTSGGGLRLQAMPPPPVSKGPNMLGVNMAQVLGRRRHTICQISDSSSPQDPLSKAKQYNYIRKFSVDISALQAQLENPKRFKDAPFQSDQNLSTKQQEKNKLKITEKPLLPLPHFGLPGTGMSGIGAETGGGSGGGGLKLNLLSRPPVITVSEEVKEEEIAEQDEEEADKVQNCSTTHPTQYTPIVNKEELTNIPRLPITQPVDEKEEEEEEGDEEQRQEETEERERDRLMNPGPGEDDDSCRSTSNDNHNRLNDSEQDFIKMTLLLALTFLVCTFPLFLVEAMKASLNVHTYVNISTCARALSTIQTIIFPHVVMCMDSVVHSAVARLKVSASARCAVRETDCMDLSHELPSSTASQV